MADQVKVDKDGYILSGRFEGRHITTVVQYAETLENAIPEGERPPAGGKEKTPEGQLAAHAGGRVDAVAALTGQRLRSDDEATFRTKVGDAEYAKYIENIKKVLDTFPAAQQVMRNVHWTIYVQLKSNEPEFEAMMLKKETPPPAETEEQKTAREKKEADDAAEAQRLKDEATAAAAVSGDKKPTTPKAAPPTAPPTPGRSGSSKERKPKLVATEKVVRAAREWGMTVDAYLMQLEDRGVSQTDLESANITKDESRRRSVYDRKVAS